MTYVIQYGQVNKMAKCLVSMYQKQYHDRITIIYNIAENFRMSYCRIAVISLLGTIEIELLKVLHSKFYEWLPYPDEMKFSSMKY